MNNLKIVGLGPGDMSFITMQALEEILAAKPVYLRTEKHPVIEPLISKGAQFESFDSFYEESETFDQVYENIAQRIMKLLEERDVTYAVPGNPFVAERTVEILIERLGAENIQFIYGVSFIDAIINQIKYDPVNGLNIVDALTLENMTNKSASIFIQVYDTKVASQLKLALMKIYEDDTPVMIIRAAGIKGLERIVKVPLYEMDRLDEYDHLTSVFIDKLPLEERKADIGDLVDVMRTLRSEEGCPWDRVQTHESLKPYLVEEAYELIDAIDEMDEYAMEEELGDVLLQVVFHTALEEERGYFTFDDVVDGIVKKLVHRHPHVFGDHDASTPDEVLDIWEQRKGKNKSYSDKMRNVPKSMPATLNAHEVQRIASKVGFDWEDVNPVIEKVKEELEELIVEINSSDMKKAEIEFGDLLFSMINLSRFLGIDPEKTLKNSVSKFVNRFESVENSEVAKSVGIENMSLQQMDDVWNLKKNIDKF